MSKMLSALVSVSVLGLVGAANAAGPAPLTDQQMDVVTAGQNPNSPTSHVGGGSGGSGGGDKHAPPNGPLKVGP